jgi:uncharacterized metal-binding protein YceD (DUF177 family)
MNRAPEFSRTFRLDAIDGEPRAVTIEADAAERAALAGRFGLVSIERLEANATLSRENRSVLARGRLRGDAVQSCVATGDPIPARVDEPFALRFDPEGESAAEEEMELVESDLDILGYEGATIDLGEAVAQGFSLALDPFPRVPDAEERLRAAGVQSEDQVEEKRIESSPFAALRGLKEE